MRRRAAARAGAAAPAASERYYLASQWQLAWRKLIRHRLALAGGGVLLLLYVAALFAGFIAPYGPFTRNNDFINAPPTPLRFVSQEGLHLRPFVYAVRGEVDMESLRRRYAEDTSRRYPVSLFVRGEPYRLWGLIETDRHLFGVAAPGVIYLLGTDDLGRDMLARVLHAGRISLSIGLLGVAFSFVLGLLFGGLSGYYGGAADLVIQRVVEFLISIPQIPLWMALSAALPANWPPLRVYFGITLILSIVGWTGLARVVRGKLLELRESDFVMAARVAGALDGAIIRRHLLPSFMSYLIVSLTLAVPGMILGETALSFLGLGLRPPVVSWGVLLQKAQNLRTVALHPWLLIPAGFVVVTVLAFNFLGDGLRDAADPYK